MTHASVSHTRRQMLFGMAGAALAYSQPRNRIYNPLLAAHTSLWLTEAALRNVRLGAILDEAFTSIRRAGYGRVELSSDFLAPELKIRTLEALHSNRLQPAIVSDSGPLWDKASAEDTRGRILETARLMSRWDTRFLDFHPADKPDGTPKNAAELETQAYQLNRMGQDLLPTGVGLMVGHHLSEMQDGAREWRYTMAHTESGLVSFCLDLDWAVRAGMRPLPLLDTAGSRLRNLPLRNPRNGVSQEVLREGDIEMVPVARYLRQSSYDGYLVVDLSANPQVSRELPLTEALSRSRWFMQEIFGMRPGSPPVDMGPHVRERKQS
jgi:sugar phosphate isomerase/epimerase